MTRDPGARRRAEQDGRRAETLCVWWLRLRGWRIVARRARQRVGEIDIVACRGATIAFIEVKARGDLATAAAAISDRQRVRLERAAAAFLASHPRFAAFGPRFDLMLVAGWRLPVHIANAWHILP